MRINYSILLATVIALGTASWILSGQFASDARTERDDAADGKNPIRKSVRERSMLKGRKLLNINGDVNSARDLTSPI